MIIKTLCLAVLIGGSSVCLAAEPTDPAKIAEVAGIIQQNLDPILTGVNEQKRPTKAEIAAWQKLSTDSRRYFQKMEPAQQSQFLMFEAWIAYFNGNIEQAHKNAVFAWNKDQTSGDAFLTQFTMSLVANKKPLLPKPQKNKTNPNQEPAGMPGGMPGMPGMPMDPGTQDPSAMTMQPGKLMFDYKSLNIKALGKKLDAQSLDCLNGATFTYQPGQEAICILATRNYEPNSVQNEPNSKSSEQTDPGMGMMPGGMPGMPGMPGMEMAGGYGQDSGSGTANEAFAKLFQRGLSTGQIKFLGLNLDAASRKQDVVEQMIKSPAPWAVVMAVEQKQKMAIDADISKAPANQPILVMVDKAGAVRYAGPATGFIAPILLGELTSATLKDIPAETQPAPASTDSAAQSNAVPTAPAEPAAPQPAEFRELSEEESIRAEQMLGPARDLFMKTARKHVTTYKNGVETCRKVMREFPGTKYAYEAQTLLRQVPEYKRDQYGITDQELGL